MYGSAPPPPGLLRRVENHTGYDRASGHTQERLWRRNLCDRAKLRRADLKKWRVTDRIGLYTKLDRKAIRYNVNKALEVWVKRSRQLGNDQCLKFWPTLQQRRFFSSFTECYKAINRLNRLDPSAFFTFAHDFRPLRANSRGLITVLNLSLHPQL